MNGYLKAVYGGVTAGLAALLMALTSNPVAGFGHITAAEWVVVASAVVAAFGSVYGVTNNPPGDLEPLEPEK